MFKFISKIRNRLHQFATLPDRLEELQEHCCTTIEVNIDGGRVYAAVNGKFQGHADQRYGHLTYSQHGEDLVFVALFEQIGIERPSYLDIGSNHPINCSNTALLYARGSRGVNFDASPDVIKLFHSARPDDVNINAGAGRTSGTMTFYRIDAYSGRNSFSKETAENFIKQYPTFRISDEIPVEVMTLDQIVHRYCAGKCPDLLSIDCEGLDLEILQAYSFRTKPAILCAETSSAAGDQAQELHEFAVSRGFRKVIQMGANGIYLDASIAVGE